MGRTIGIPEAIGFKLKSQGMRAVRLRGIVGHECLTSRLTEMTGQISLRGRATHDQVQRA